MNQKYKDEKFYWRTKRTNPVAPHFDRGYAGTVCLNKPGEYIGGTGFYRNKIYNIHDYFDVKISSNVHNMPKYDFIKMIRPKDYENTPRNSFVNDGDDYW